MTVTGLPALLFLLPWVIGAAICGLSGIYLASQVAVWLIERIVRNYQFNREFFTFLYKRAQARRAQDKKETD